MEEKNTTPPLPDDPETGSSPVEEFFLKLKPEMRRPKPSDEAVEAARQAIERLEMQSMRRDEMGPQSHGHSERCACGFENPAGNHFCGACGNLLARGDARTVSAQPAGRHHYHHHFHHFPGMEGGIGSLLGSGTVANGKRESARVTSSSGVPTTLSRAEATIRKLVQDWALAGNTKKLDDLAELYSADALLMRPNQATLRGTAAIREYFVATLDAGLGDIELEPLRTAVAGDIAFEAGRCKCLTPVAVGKRREERGKYVLVFARQSNGEWQITVDCWSADLGLKSGADAEPARTTPPGPRRVP